MIVDARQFSPDSITPSDLCIVGGGPLGLLLAKQLTRPGRNIFILEGGGMEARESAQKLLQGEDQTGEYHDLSSSRHSQLGGTVNIWNTRIDGEMGAKHVPLDAIDFEKRDWVPHSGWPFTRETLVPYYRRAHELCGLGPFGYAAEDWSDQESPPFKFNDSKVKSEVYQLAGPHPLLKDLRAFVESSKEITCVVNAPVSEFMGDEGSREVRQVRVALSSEQSIYFQSGCFVLAAGGIENARLLLASTHQCAKGLGNEHDVVGRYYMDHPVYFFTEFLPLEPDLFVRSGFYDLRKVRRTNLLGRLTLSQETLRTERLLNLSVVLYPKIAGYRSKGVEALREFRVRIRQRKLLESLPYALPSLFGMGDVVRYSRCLKANPFLEGSHYWQPAATNGARFRTFEPEFYLEQAPDPANRILLSQKRDALGRPLAAASWSWGRQSQESAHRAAEILGEAFQKSNLGQLRLLNSPRLNPSAHHHIGATRMANDPKAGVVDENARLHGADNLYIAGSSLFPTGGYANPTLTALALCLKLIDHLQPKIGPN